MEHTKMPPSPTKLVLYLEDIYYDNFENIWGGTKQGKVRGERNQQEYVDGSILQGWGRAVHTRDIRIKA